MYFGIDIDTKDFEYALHIAYLVFRICEKLQLVEIYESNKGYHLRFAPAISKKDCLEIMDILDLFNDDDMYKYFMFARDMGCFVLREFKKYQSDKGVIDAPKLVKIFTREEIMKKFK